MLKKLNINICFLKVVTYMPSYAKFQKDLFSNNGKLSKHITVTLTEEYNVIIQNKLPPNYLILLVSLYHVSLTMLLSVTPYVILEQA